MPHQKSRDPSGPSVINLDGDLLAGLLVQSKGHRSIGSLANLLPHLSGLGTQQVSTAQGNRATTEICLSYA